MSNADPPSRLPNRPPSGGTATAWGSMLPHDVERFGEVILDPNERRRWCAAILIGGLPFIWNELAPVPLQLFLDRLELSPGDRVLLVGESLEGVGIDRAIRERIGPEGELTAVDFLPRVRDLVGGGEWPQWDWDYASEYPDASFDAVAVFQGVAHAADWGREARELLRVVRPGRRIVLGEIVFGPPMADVIRQDLHVTYVFTKLWEALFPGEVFEDQPYWGAAALRAAFAEHAVETESFAWRGAELFWARKPPLPAR